MAAIINADDGAISGASGLKLSSDTSGALNIQTNGVTAIAISASQVVSFPATTTITFGSLNVTVLTSASATITNLIATSGSITTLTNNPTFGAGTANGMLYLNGSNVVTSGSAVVFNGTNMGIGGNPSNWQSGRTVLQITPSSTQGHLAFGGVISNISTNAFVDSTPAWKYIANGISALYQQDEGRHFWYTAASGTAGNAITWTQAMTLNASGNLGIGTTTINYRVVADCAGSGSNDNGIAVRNDNNSAYGGSYNFEHKVTSGGSVVRASYISSEGGGGTSFLRFATTNASTLAERVRITGAGDFLIGTTGVSSKLAVSGVNTTYYNTATFTNGTDPQYLDIMCGRALTDGSVPGVASSLVMTFRSSGSSAGIIAFATGNTEQARINTDGEFWIRNGTDQGNYSLQVGATGVWAAGAYVNGSDERLKKNIQPLNSGLDVVGAMRPVTFQYKPEYSKDQSVQPGFIAQELQQAMAGKPYLDGVVQSGPEYLNVAYQSIIPILVKAIQELKSELDQLKGRI